ncbi:MAG: TPM domain-containing protein [Rudaea sp.]
MDIARTLRHLFAEGSARRHFPPRVLDSIQQAIAAGERRHQDQVCFAVEGALPLRELWHGHTPRERARRAFAHLRVWDTQHHSGVLIYVLLADRAIEILADRGIAAKVDEAEWQSICAQMQQHFAAAEFERGAIEGVNAVSDILARHFPADASTRANELPDRPVVL